MRTDLDFIVHDAAKRVEDYKAFRYYVELDERSDEELDSLVETIAAPIIAGMDCTHCANCCRSLDIYLTESDTQRLSPIVQIDEIIDHNQATKVEEWGVFRHKPCTFLNGNLCSIYKHRPESCRLYPAFTPDFRWTLDDILSGVGLCPIIYNVVEELQKILDW